MTDRERDQTSREAEHPSPAHALTTEQQTTEQMQIKYKWWNNYRPEEYTTEAEKVKTYKGHDIYKDAQGWLYVETPEGWRYFGTMRAAKTFINDLELTKL